MALPSAPVSQSAGAVIPAATLNSYYNNLNYLLAVPCGSIYQTTAQSLVTATYTAVTFDSEDFDTDTAHSTSTNTSRITPATAGYYLFCGSVEFAANAAGRRGGKWRMNGNAATEFCESLIPASAASTVAAVIAPILQHFNGSTDYVELFAFQDSGGNLALGSVNAARPRVSWFWVGS